MWYRSGCNQKTPIFRQLAGNPRRSGGQVTVKETLPNAPVERIIRAGLIGKDLRVVTIMRVRPSSGRSLTRSEIVQFISFSFAKGYEHIFTLPLGIGE